MRPLRLLFGLLALLASLPLCGYARIHDEVFVHPLGDVRVRRTVSLPAAERMDSLLAVLHSNRPELRPSRGVVLAVEALKARACSVLTAKPERWTRAHFEGNTLYLEKDWLPGKSSFVTTDDRTVTFALHHFLSEELTQPPFPLDGVGPVMRSDAEHRAYLADWRDHEGQLLVTVHMPGPIEWLWDETSTQGLREVEVDLLATWPPDRDTWIRADRGLLFARALQMPAATLVLLGLSFLARRVRRGIRESA